MISRNVKSSKKRRGGTNRLRERANLSFFIVIIFFAVFGIIVLTEIFFIDERHGMGNSARGQHRGGSGSDYEDIVLSDDYMVYRGPGGAGGTFDDNVGVFLRGVEETHLGARLLAPVPQNAPLRAEELPLVMPESWPLFAKPSNLTPIDGQWQPVKGTRFKFFVYSAFYDRRGSRMIRVIGATRTRSPERVCARPELVAAKVRVIRENWNLKYSACFVLCPLPRINASYSSSPDAWPVPVSVAILAGRALLPPGNRLRVRNSEIELLNASRQDPAAYGRNLAVCVKPLHFSYNQALTILEFLEFQSILGVRHFTMYNHTIGPAVSCILNDYVRRGVLTLLPWQLPMVSQREIRTEGLFAALNDCLYRNMYRYGYVALVDLDEYIVPRRNDSLPALLSWLSRPGTRAAGSFSFQNAFFYLQWLDDNSSINGPDLITQRKTRRRAKLHPHKQRSKYICKPELVVEAGNHFVWEYVPGRGTLNVPADAAILHHYRVCEFGGDDCVKAASVVDRTAQRFGAQLKESVTKRWLDLQKSCSLPPIPTVPFAAAKLSDIQG
ncbi:hypothetical protein B566_EDAN008601 [Ephemera danica]|nr:hypothetical protein B566_EDAN008601 [Ephemera danica]